MTPSTPPSLPPMRTPPIFQWCFPWLLALGRGALAPVLIFGQQIGWSGPVLAALVAVGLVSDVLDGVLARRWHTDTDALRLTDSMTDIVFYLGTAIAFALQCPELWDVFRPWAATLIALEALRFALDLVRFRRPASYHAFLAKLTGLLLSSGVVLAFAVSDDALPWLAIAGSTLYLGFAIGILSQLEGLLISLTLPVWRRDVRNLAEAWRLRRQLREQPLATAAQ